MKPLRIYTALAAMMLLCGCTSLDSGSSGTGTGMTASGTQATGETGSGTQTTGETGTGTQAAGDPAGSTDQTAASVPSDALDVRMLFPAGGSVALSGSGVVFARDGLNLRSQPTASSQKLALLKHGAAVKVKNAVCAAVKKHTPECWYQVEAGGKTGFISAEFAAVSFDTPVSAMDDTQRSALGILLFRQAYKLNWYFTQEGGIAATAYLTQKEDAEGWIPLEPKGLTVEKLLADYRKYFAMDFPYDINNCYREKDGTLYVMDEHPENPYVDYEELAFLTAATDDSLTYRTRAQWYTTGEFVMVTENDGVTEDDFVLNYTDGIWKIARFVPAI